MASQRVAPELWQVVMEECESESVGKEANAVFTMDGEGLREPEKTERH